MNAKIFSFLAASAMLSVLLLMGCNAFDGMEKATDSGMSTQDKIVHARRLLSENECYQARDLLLTVAEPPNDEYRVTLGWSHLCVAGATAANIAVSIYNYTQDSLNTTVIGTLARQMLPARGDQVVSTQAAIDMFQGMNDASRSQIEVAIAEFARASSILAQQATNDGTSTLTQTDISLSGCSNSCVTCSLPGMSDGDITLFANAISTAATQLAAANATNLKSLATQINSGVSGATDAARCFIYKNAIPSP